MTLTEAVSILLRCTEKYMAGAGQGLSQRPRDDEREKIKEAVIIAWKRVYGWEPTKNELSRFKL